MLRKDKKFAKKEKLTWARTENVEKEFLL